MVAVATSDHPCTRTLHREVGRVDLCDNLRQHVALLPDQRGGDPAQRCASARPNLRGVRPQCSGDLKNSNPAVLILPPVSTMKGTKLLWSLYFAALMSLYIGTLQYMYTYV